MCMHFARDGAQMLCDRCKTPFCWLCLAKLPTSDPYSHFNSGRGRCAGRLFDGLEDIESDGDDNEASGSDDDEDFDIMDHLHLLDD